MLTRVQLPLALVLIAGCTHAQAPKPAQTQPAPRAIQLPGIIPNLKWTVNQNAAQLLLNVDVQKDLNLSDDTKGALMKIYAAYDKKYTSLTAGKTENSDALQAQLDGAIVESADQAVGVLTPEQAKRLSQIGIQAMGLDALRMAEVRTAIGLSTDQSSALDKRFAELDEKQSALDAELGSRLSKLADPGPKASDEENAAHKRAVDAVIRELDPQNQAIEDLKKADWKAFFDSLNPDETATWAKVHGAPVRRYPG